MMDQLGFLDILTLVSFVLQVQNQSNIIRMSDVQEEVQKAVADLHQHLAKQDDKIYQILHHYTQ